MSGLKEKIGDWVASGIVGNVAWRQVAEEME